MAQYINKSALVAEIKRRRDESWLGMYTKEKGIIFDITDEILSLLDTLEIKEVDMEKEIKRFTMSKELYEADSAIKAVAEHFYELGLNTKMEE